LDEAREESSSYVVSLPSLVDLLRKANYLKGWNVKVNKKIVRIAFGLLVALMAISFASCTQSVASPVKTVTLRMQSSWSAGLFTQEQPDLFAELVSEMSGGRLKIESNVGGAIVPAMDVFTAVDSGIIDISHSNSFNWLAHHPAAPLFGSRPFGLNPTEFLSWMYGYGGIEMWQEMYKDFNFGWVGPCGMNFAEDFAWTNRELKTLDDFKNLKFRTVGYWGHILNSIGASVMTLPGGELYSALSTGVLDATEFSNPEADFKLGLHEVCKYVYTPGVHQPTSIAEIIINKDVWNNLTPDLQLIIQMAAKAVTMEAFARSTQNDLDAIRKFQEYGTIIQRLPETLVEQIKVEADKFYEQRCAEDPFFKKVYESQEQCRADSRAYMEVMDTAPYNF
jgi:TRAP-type mannitol/chloroaromatic compound transport system substrate-binding protein